MKNNEKGPCSNLSILQIFHLCKIFPCYKDVNKKKNKSGIEADPCTATIPLTGITNRATVNSGATGTAYTGEQ